MRMNRIVVGTVASLLALGSIAPAFADDHHGRGHDRREARDDRRERRDDRREWRDDRREWRDDRREARDDRRYHDNRHHYRPAPPRVVYRPAPPPRVVYRPAPGPGYGWARGHRYNEYYRGPVYVVNDYSRYSVRRPPRGHHWIRDDRGNLLLVAIASGIIADFVINSR
ncbi:RcnB family protein [Stenotrophomonas sp. NPDC077464]|uniref:RcnB family protein n=1 Tax=unclassified Stenotrophomonas TaxID=196198 RepID=UPI0037D7E403